MKTLILSVYLLLILLGLLPPMCKAAGGDATYGPIVFKSAKVAQWQLNSRFEQHAVDQLHGVESGFLYPERLSLSISARRPFLLGFDQQVYASFNTLKNPIQYSPEWRYNPDELGTYTKFGWLVGQPTGLNMAIEFEHREVRESENNALTIGVHYIF